MKLKFLFFVTVLFLAVGIKAQESPLRFGVKAGVNLSNFSGDADGSDAKFGFNAGVTVDYAITDNWLIMSGLEFTTKGFKYKETVDLIDYEVGLKGKTEAKLTVNLMYLQLPIHVGYRLPISNDVNLLFHAGPYFAYGVGGKTTVKLVGFRKDKDDSFSDDFLKRFDFGLGAGAGAEFGNINVGLGYDFGLVNISQESSVTYRNMNGYLSVGYKF